jgi:hypothetical protein
MEVRCYFPFTQNNLHTPKSTSVRTLETTYWTPTSLVALIKDEDQRTLSEAIIAVRYPAVPGVGINLGTISNPKRIRFAKSTDTQEKQAGQVRANDFYYQYNQSTFDGRFVPYKSSTGLFSWRDDERLDIELSSYPSLGAPLGTIPAASTLPRLQEAQATWQVRFLERNKNDQETNWSSWLSVPAKGSAFTQDVEGTTLLGGRNLNALYLDGRLTNALGTFPGCYERMQVQASVITPDELGSLSEINACGPFPLRWKVSGIPEPFVSLSSNISNGENPDDPPVAGVNAAIPSRFITSNAIVYYQWSVRSKLLNERPPDIWEWEALPFFTPTISFPLTASNTQYEVRLRAVIAPQANAPLQCTVQLDGITVLNNDPTTLMAKVLESATQSAATAARPRFTCSPNPASEQTTLSYSLGQEATISIEILDALQRTVLQPIQAESREAGAYLLAIPLHTLPSGVYSIRFSSHHGSQAPLRRVQPLIIQR